MKCFDAFLNKSTGFIYILLGESIIIGSSLNLRIFYTNIRLYNTSVSVLLSVEGHGYVSTVYFYIQIHKIPNKKKNIHTPQNNMVSSLSLPFFFSSMRSCFHLA